MRLDKAVLVYEPRYFRINGKVYRLMSCGIDGADLSLDGVLDGKVATFHRKAAEAVALEGDVLVIGG